MIITATRIRAGNIIDMNGDPCRVMAVQHVVTGRGSGGVQTKMRNLRTGTQFEQRFRSSEAVSEVELDHHEMEFLYRDDAGFHFMNTQSYEQISLTEEVLGETAKWLQENLRISMLFYNEQVVGASPPKTMVLRVEETKPRMRGATQTAMPKPAKLENGVTVSVPEFVETGDLIRVDTIEEAYVERVKE